ncbi:MAG: N-acetylmuramoyl-L-alanine amidase [Pseudomonadota bacterium]|nr:N-acetylmuramoyl-L-alanine amidase [Pseudomonadota bacterium]
MKWTRFVLTFSLLWVFGLATALAETVLQNVRVSDTSSVTRLVFELSGPFQYKNFNLQSPSRYVIDFKDVVMEASLPKLLAGSAVKNIRSSTRDHQLRIVLDLSDRVNAKVFEVPCKDGCGPRLVIDITHPTHSIRPTHPKIEAEQKADADSDAEAEAKPEAKANDESDEEETEIIIPHSKARKVAEPDGARDIVVVIDPGHGGKDPGASGAMGTKEKDIVLAIARKLQASINREPGFKAVLTRDGDYFIGLRGRLAIAHKHKGDMFIAIHADAARHQTAHGVGVYAVSQRGATSEAARWLANRENESEFVGGLDLADKDHVLRSVLIDLSQTHTISASLQIGSVLLRQLSKFAELHHAGVEQAAFVVLKSPDIPSLLVETGFLSNPSEERRLLNSNYQWQIVDAVKSGIKTYFVSNPPRGTQVAIRSGSNQI